MVSKRRRESLIPLSREHHYALMVCLRINRGIKNNGEDQAWIRAQARKTTLFFDTELVPHFHAEETVVFPAMKDMPESHRYISILLQEHKEIRSRIESLRQMNDAMLKEELLQFAALLEAHIRKEERELFPIYEGAINADSDAIVQQEVLRLIGNASQPRHPELLD